MIPAQYRQANARGLLLDQMTEAQREQFLFLAILSDTQDVLDDPAIVRFQVSAGRPQRPTKEGEPWIVSANISCRDNDNGLHSPFNVAYTPPERKKPVVAPATTRER